MGAEREIETQYKIVAALLEIAATSESGTSYLLELIAEKLQDSTEELDNYFSKTGAAIAQEEDFALTVRE